MDILVERALKARLRSSGQEIDVRILVGRPYWITQDSEAACPAALEGIYGDLKPMSGVDPLDALQNAIKLVEKLIVQTGDRYEYFWPNGERYEPVER